ncbi:sensor histidine kinase [Rhodanobacter thiooxydans]|uniref:sensor histidine kinase n=1 Tax=Rhodanobacter thiooxydans TaxID=416169 RepID=UPI001F30824E|nr:HAMP domain-containing sensor histidine kinase [Rhodanobacter thiooxydans]UJJ56743.1 HAMP domain-containing histidine kinase [Rhodanobacter thiooxydans]
MNMSKRTPAQRLRTHLRANLRANLSRLRTSVVEGAQVAENRMALLGALAVVAQPLFYVVFGILFPQPHENLWLRLVIVLLGLPIVLEPVIPPKWRRHLPIYWLLYITATLPLFSTYMLLMNGISAAWLAYQVAAIMLVFMLFDARAGLLSVFVGCGLGVILDNVFHHAEIHYRTLGPVVAVWLFAGAGAVICDLSRAIAWRVRTHSLQSVTATISHELRTPLASIRLAALGLDRHFPELIAGYDAAIAAGLIRPRMRARSLAVVRELADTVSSEAEHAQVTIEMLLAAAQATSQQAMGRVDAGATVSAAAARYPYGSSAERGRVHVAIKDNFCFFGWAPALTNVIFNLLKNAIHYTAKKSEAMIHVQVDRVEGGRGRITVFDTGTGIAPSTLPRVFERYVSGKDRPETALGIGLAYCQDVVRKMSGTITCSSTEGIFTRFVITFPILAEDAPSAA